MQVPQAYAEADYSNSRLQNQNEPSKHNPFTFRERIGPNPQPQALETTFEAREKDVVNNGAIIESIVEPRKPEEEEPPKKAFVTNEVEKRVRLTNKRPAKTDIRISLAKHSYIYPLGIAEDVLVDVVGYVYPMDFMILNIKEDEKRPFILGTPFLTTAKAVIKFDKDTITLRSGKSKISFHRIPESLCKVEKGINKDIETISLTMTVNRLVLEWKE
nr:reverse transcriptase domain-containing protein [Tanacetum cinerariifolium]